MEPITDSKNDIPNDLEFMDTSKSSFHDLGNHYNRFARRLFSRQVLKESLGLPSSARSPMRFTASLRKAETAKTVRPTGVPEKGPSLGQET